MGLSLMHGKTFGWADLKGKSIDEILQINHSPLCVVDLINSETRCWKMDEVLAAFGVEIATTLFCISISWIPYTDRLIWRLANNGEFFCYDGLPLCKG